MENTNFHRDRDRAGGSRPQGNSVCNSLAEEGVHTDIEVNCRRAAVRVQRSMRYVPSSFEEYLRTVTDEQLADIKNKLAASIGIEPQIVEKKLSGSTGGDSESNIAPAVTQKCCDAEVQAYDPGRRREDTAEGYRELYKT